MVLVLVMTAHFEQSSSLYKSDTCKRFIFIFDEDVTWCNKCSVITAHISRTDKKIEFSSSGIRPRH